MSLQDLSLPIDVPWRLIATSPDMLATRSNPFPYSMWRSSLAVFSYDPDLTDYPDTFPDRELTFLKVVCSATSYTPPCLPPPVDAINSLQSYIDFLTNIRDSVQSLYNQATSAGDATTVDYYAGVIQTLNDSISQQQSWLKAIEDNWENQVHTSMPCSGALIQVALYPKQEAAAVPGNILFGVNDATDYKALAYFASFEPQKRELIEAATESGEAMTQSKSDVNVRKGLTSTDSVEDLDVFTGANLNVGFGGASVGGGVSGQWGTIKKSATERSEVTNTDSSKESREGSSHTTSLSQLYHLLNSYHLGTNRAIFFVQPRPHTLQQKDQFTFINGPQDIEGIQEFFLVVSRPKGTPIDSYCVESLLFTAHLDEQAATNALNEPKTLETNWLDIWVAAGHTGSGGGGFDLGSMIADIVLPGIPGLSDPITMTQQTVSEVQNQMTSLQNQWNSLTANNSGPVQPKTPAMVAKYVTPAVMNDPLSQSLSDTPDAPVGRWNGWKIDRTRGLGGYDLWENPANYSATPLGQDQKGVPPQAFIDIVSFGSPDDLLNYHPDYALRITAQVWPSDGKDAFYHGKIKVYFVRNDMATAQRTVPMMLTARGVSSCRNSPLAGFYSSDQNWLAPGEQPQIVAESVIHPPSVAPWKGGNQPSPFQQSNQLVTNSSGDSQPTASAAPIFTGSANPSGLDAGLIGAARSKMANSMSKCVKVSIQAQLNCLTIDDNPESIAFITSDYVFTRMGKALIAAEINNLAVIAAFQPDLAKSVANHSALGAVLGAMAPRIFTTLQNAAKKVAAKAISGRARVGSHANSTAAPPSTLKTLKGLIPNEVYSLPILTLTHPSLPSSSRQILNRGGIKSALDLVGVSGEDLAKRLGTKQSVARQIRLEVLGIANQYKVAATLGTAENVHSKRRRKSKR